jgi:hypothetical protein
VIALTPRPSLRTPEPQSTQTLIVLYVALVILEGALRKWLLPGGLNSLVAIARDPIALVLLWRGYCQGLFQHDRLLIAWLVLVFVLATSGLLAQISSAQPLMVWVFGLRTACLHFALIPIVARLITLTTLQNVLLRLLALAGPIALLMVWQYRSPVDAWINRVALDGGSLLLAAGGKVRPPGPFSFATGTAEYYALINAVLAGGFVSRTLHSRWLIYGLTFTVLAASVSGSRLFWFYVLVVWAGTFALHALRTLRLPRLEQVLKSAGLAALIALVLVFTPLRAFVAEGWETTSARFEEADAYDGGVLARATRSISVSDYILSSTPPWGHGLGLGSNFGARLQQGTVGFLLEENEWPRMIQESGLAAGGLFILFRLFVAVVVGSRAWTALAAGNALGLALFFSNLPILINGNIVRPTSMGFVVLSMAFSLAASRFALELAAGRTTTPQPSVAV